MKLQLSEYCSLQFYYIVIRRMQHAIDSVAGETNSTAAEIDETQTTKICFETEKL